MVIKKEEKRVEQKLVNPQTFFFYRADLIVVTQSCKSKSKYG